MSALERIWEELSRQDVTGQGWLTRRVQPASACGLYAAIVGGARQPAIMLDAATSSLPAACELPRARGFAVEIVVQKPGPGGRLWLALTLIEKNQRLIFGVLAEDIVAAAGRAGSEPAAVRAFLSRLRDWQAFMERQEADGLSRDAQTGLFGELLFLEEVALVHLPVHDALRAWEGPEGGLHDWRQDGIAIEVKATTAVPPFAFTVSHVAQLDESRIPHLLVCHHALEENATGRSLPQLVQDIEQDKLHGDDVASELFARRLLHAGYHPAMSDRYESRRLRLAVRRTFRVQEGFPHLRCDDLPAGITSCSYNVALAACMPFAIDMASLLRLLRGSEP